MDALTELSVTVNDVGAQRLSDVVYARAIARRCIRLFLLSGGASITILRVVIVVIVSGTPHVLMDGVVTNQQIQPGSDAGSSTLSITGEDLTVLMDKIDFSGFPFPATPAEGRVALLLLKYAFLGLIPLIIPSVLIDVPIPTTRIPAQQGTDLAYIKELADNVGYVFYLDPGPAPGTNVAYWGPQIKVGPPQTRAQHQYGRVIPTSSR